MEIPHPARFGVPASVLLWIGRADRGRGRAAGGAPRWNVMGLLLANILGVALPSTPLFAYFGPDRLNVWVMGMPYTLLPAVTVLAAWAGHLIVFRALRQDSRSIQAGSSM